MGWINKKRLGGIAVLAAGFIANEVFGWGLGRMMDYVADSVPLADAANWPWGAWLSVVLIIVGLALIFWPSPKGPTLARKLHVAADHALASIPFRGDNPWATGELDYARSNIVGESALVTFRKASFKIPKLPDDKAAKAEKLKFYFQELVPFLEDGHLKEAREKAEKIATDNESA